LAIFDGASRAVRSAKDLVAEAAAIGIEVRAGLHAGEVEMRSDDIAGLPVAIGKRICDLAAPGQVLVSSTVKDLMAGSGIVLADRGEHELKGVPDRWHLYSVVA
jgi:class 3 adenylate cyclase